MVKDITETNGKVSQRELYDSINDFRKEVNGRFDGIEKQFVLRTEFEPVQKFVSGMIGVGGLILITILGLVLAHVIPGFNL
jgi:hypothetical protein